MKSSLKNKTSMTIIVYYVIKVKYKKVKIIGEFPMIFT